MTIADAGQGPQFVEIAHQVFSPVAIPDHSNIDCHGFSLPGPSDLLRPRSIFDARDHWIELRVRVRRDLFSLGHLA